MRSLKLLFIILLLALTGSSVVMAESCEFSPPPGWGGFVDLPPLCPAGFEGPITIITRPEGGISGPGALRGIIINTTPESIPNERVFFTGNLVIQGSGYGDLSGFEREILIPVTGEMQFDPQIPFAPNQMVGGLIVSLDGQLFGDPDFCTLNFGAGSETGFPCPGETSIDLETDGDFNVDSFFDITYEIDFVGCPGSFLEGIDGTTSSSSRIRAGELFTPDTGPSCALQDNGFGLIDLPPECPEGYRGVLNIRDGLSPGTEITGDAVLRDYQVVLREPGGILGGEIQIFEAVLFWHASGTGELAGFNRDLIIPVTCETHSGPRNPGEDVQTFPTELVSMQGSLFGDPDFCELGLVAGVAGGLPSPGSTTTTKLPDGSFAVDSFFDITYEIDFQGCPGSILDGRSGATIATDHFQAGEPYLVSSAENNITAPRAVLFQNSPNPFNPATVIRYELPEGLNMVALDIFDLRGGHVCSLINGVQLGGIKSVTWHGTDSSGRRAPSGVYFYSLKTPSGTLIRKMAVLK